jgi:peptidoglycan/LPS O-acetylase OafA/YrhL
VRSDNREIIALTSLRGIAALWVLAFHLVANLSISGYIAEPRGVAGRLLNGGEFAVDLFFVLSGYVLTLSAPQVMIYRDFIVRRVARVFPLHLLTLGVMAIGIGSALRGGVGTKDIAYFSFASLPAHFSLTWAWFGMPLAWNSPTWSLSVEFAGYLVFPFVLTALRGASRPVRIALLLGAMAGQALLLTTTDYPSTGGLALMRGAFGLTIGVLLRLLFVDRALPGAGAAGLAVIAALSFGQPGIAALCVAGLIVTMAHARESRTERFMTAPPIAWLGRVSFSIYVLHVPVLIVLLQLLRRIPMLQTPGGLIVFSICYIGLVLASAAVTWRLVERRGQHMVRALFA